MSMISLGDELQNIFEYNEKEVKILQGERRI